MAHRAYGRAAIAAAAATWLCLMTTAGTAAEMAAEATPPPIQAIGKQQKINFHFQSFTTYYSCDGLENKVERILRALGTRAKVRVRSVDCSSGVARLPYVDIDVTSPVEATPEALAARDQDKSKSTRELAARVKGERLEGADAGEQFSAQWKRVSLSRGRLGLEPGDCELVEEVRRKVLPKLAVRIVQDDLSCSPHQLSLGQPKLEVEALVQLPKPDGDGKK
jgi:hypothetical protein